MTTKIPPLVFFASRSYQRGEILSKGKITDTRPILPKDFPKIEPVQKGGINAVIEHIQVVFSFGDQIPLLRVQELLEVYTKQYPKNPHLHALLAKVLSKQRKNLEASTVIEEAFRLGINGMPGSEAHLTYSHIYYDLGEYQKAFEAIQAACEREPNHPQLWIMRVRILQALNRFSAALKSIKRVRQLMPKDEKILILQKEIEAALLRQEQEMAQKSKVREKPGTKKTTPLEVITPAIAQDSSNPKFWDRKISDLMKRSAFQEALGMLDEARKHLRGDDPKHLSLRARCLYELGHFQEALGMLDEARKYLRGDNPEHLSLRARCLYELGHFQEALEIMQKIVSPGTWGISVGSHHLFLGKIQFELKLYREAKESLEKAIKLDPRVKEASLSILNQLP